MAIFHTWCLKVHPPNIIFEFLEVLRQSKFLISSEDLLSQNLRQRTRGSAFLTNALQKILRYVKIPESLLSQIINELSVLLTGNQVRMLQLPNI